MKIIFFGLGSIGQKHLKILSESGDHELYAFRTNRSDARTENLSIEQLHAWQEVDEINPEVAFITNPTGLHIETALECAKRGIKLFIEKPIGGSTVGLDELLSLVIKDNITTYVAYDLRFHPVILKLREYLLEKQDEFLHLQAYVASYLPSWRPGRDHLKSYSAHKNLGGGVILDLSHEVDYVHYLLGGTKKLSGQFTKRSNLTVDCEDYADILAETAFGPAVIHMNFFSHHEQRTIVVDLKTSTVCADLINHRILIYQNNKIVEQLNFEKEDVYKRQMEYFFANIDNPSMMNNLVEASELFKLLCELKENFCYV